MEVFVNQKLLITLNVAPNCTMIKEELYKHFRIDQSDYYLLANGKLISENDILSISTVHLVPRLVGGKGGFGSMLRAIGAQIEKTTNREACRDLSGRRLRDINEEQRLKNWIAAQAEREKEAAERKQKKLERLCQLPKHEFKDEEYDRERSELPEKVIDAVEQGLKVAGASGVTVKRKQDTKDAKKKKKPKLWVDADVEDELSSSDGEGSDNEDGSHSSSAGSSLERKDAESSENVFGSTSSRTKQSDSVTATISGGEKVEGSVEVSSDK